MDKIVLFEKEADCCACGACLNICPKQAISMVKNEYGYVYPHIDEDNCVKCGACKSVCAYQNKSEDNTPLNAYAAVNKDEGQKLISASGGLFAAFATKIVRDGGVVFGSTLEKIGDEFVPHHIAVEKLEDIPRLQGSKYVQSATENTYKEALSYLQKGRTVLYSGTPCQIAGLKGFLKKDYDNLILVDLICHGVPSNAFFNDYLKTLQAKRKYSSIDGYSFRDKTKGWGMNCRINATAENGRSVIYYTPARLQSYNTLFLDGLIYRENCYSCKYACNKRPGDITIGDYWGVTNEHPEIIGKNGFVEKDGISCLIANTPKGAELCAAMEDYIEQVPSVYEKVAKMNKQLNAPYPYNDKRDKILEIYKNDGYAGVEDLYRVKYRKQRIVHFVFNKLPRGMRNAIKKHK